MGLVNLAGKPLMFAGMEGVEVHGTNAAWAMLDPEHKYRYLLGRSWDDTGLAYVLSVVMLNPSVAVVHDDPTIRKVIGFAKRLGCGGILVANLGARISTYPEDLLHSEDAVGPRNQWAIQHCLRHSPLGPKVVAWGSQPKRIEKLFTQSRVHAYMVGGTGLTCWGFAKSGAPRHPLMLAYATPLVSFSGGTPP
jgi:hypothetical protein